ncbi:AraC family transcriptional regulator [Mucilaginibacter sp. UYCu711]|uniref:AraC family transcriptional regulator n=1 Tax=Mucilaginibacter sp. UYCu711 TaxID=3156339 RepID=UPI003D25CD80
MKARFIEVSAPGRTKVYLKNVNEPHLSTPLHFHELCELVYISESYGKRIVGDNVQEFQPGDLVLMGPNLPHIWYNAPIYYEQNSELKARATVVYFPEDLLVNFLDDEQSVALVQNFMSKVSRGIRFYGDTLLEARQRLDEMDEHTGLKRLANLLLLCEQLINSDEYELLSSPGYHIRLNQSDTKRVHNIYVYVMEHFKEQITLNDVASLANLTPTAFCRFFKKHAGKSFSRFVNELRIAHACKLLYDLELPITAICYESGFQNMTNFNKFFRRIKNCSPSQYRSKIKLA